MAPSDTDKAYRQNPDVSERQMDTSLFLASRVDSAVYHLNPAGAALWQLLAEPMTIADAAKILNQAFPDIEQARIADDVTSIIAELESRGLVLVESHPVGSQSPN